MKKVVMFKIIWLYLLLILTTVTIVITLYNKTQSKKADGGRNSLNGEIQV